MTTAPLDDSPLYVILREHEEYGPFCKETLLEAVANGNVVTEDWVRTADRSSCWTSVGQILYGPPEPEKLTVKWHRLCRRMAASATQVLSAIDGGLESCATRLHPHTGLIAFGCIAIASALATVPDSPMPILVPWVAAGVIAGIALILRRRVFGGLTTCLAAAVVPLVTFRTVVAVNQYMDPNRRENALPPIGEMYSNMPPRSAGLHKDRPTAKSGIPALGLPQPTADEP